MDKETVTSYMGPLPVRDRFNSCPKASPQISTPNVDVLSGTEPKATSSLWELVRIRQMDLGPTLVSRETENEDGTVSKQSIQSPTTSPLNKPASAMNSSCLNSEVSNNICKWGWSYHQDFQRGVLATRGVKVVLNHYTLVLSHVHFGVEKPDGEREDYYTTIRGASHSLIWTEVNQDSIMFFAEYYTHMEERELWDAEFAGSELPSALTPAAAMVPPPTSKDPIRPSVSPTPSQLPDPDPHETRTLRDAPLRMAPPSIPVPTQSISVVEKASSPPLDPSQGQSVIGGNGQDGAGGPMSDSGSQSGGGKSPGQEADPLQPSCPEQPSNGGSVKDPGQVVDPKQSGDPGQTNNGGGAEDPAHDSQNQNPPNEASPVDSSSSKLDIQLVSGFSHTQTPQPGGDPQVSNIKEPDSESVDDPVTGSEGSDDPQPASPNKAAAALAISYAGTTMHPDSSSQYNLPGVGNISPGGLPMTTNKVVYSMAPSAAALVSNGVNIPITPAADPPPDLP